MRAGLVHHFSEFPIVKAYTTVESSKHITALHVVSWASCLLCIFVAFIAMYFTKSFSSCIIHFFFLLRFFFFFFFLTSRIHVVCSGRIGTSSEIREAAFKTDVELKHGI